MNEVNHSTTETHALHCTAQHSVLSITREKPSPPGWTACPIHDYGGIAIATEKHSITELHFFVQRQHTEQAVGLRVTRDGGRGW